MFERIFKCSAFVNAWWLNESLEKVGLKYLNDPYILITSTWVEALHECWRLQKVSKANVRSPNTKMWLVHNTNLRALAVTTDDLCWSRFHLD